MSNKQSPFNNINYQWPYGSDGWNVGMDENMVKLSFLSVKVVDSFETVLPSAPVTEGRSCVLPDNTVNFFVDGSWYTVTPTDGEIWVVADKEYTITLGAFSEVLQASTLEAEVTPKIDKLMDENKTIDLGNISGSTTVTLNGKGYVKGVVVGNTTFIFNDTPISGEFASWYLELEMTGDYTVAFPATVWDGAVSPTLGTSGKYVINFKTTPTNRFGSVEVGGVNTETSQGSFIGSAVVIPGTNPATSTSSSTPPDLVTTQSGDVFLRENRRALLTDATQMSSIRNFAPWLEVRSYITDLSANITWLSSGNVITGKMLDYLWDETTQVYVVLAVDVSGTGSTANRCRILTTTDFVTFTKTTGLDGTSILGAASATAYYYLKRVKNFAGVVNFIVVEHSENTSGDISFYRASSYSSTTWTLTTGPSFVTNLGTAASSFILNTTDALLTIYPDTSATGRRNIQYYNGSWVKTNVLGSSLATDIVYADYDGVSKWYLSLENGTVVDQTNTSIGISFVGGTSGTSTIAIPPIVRYIPELAGWFAIEYNTNSVAPATTITYQPKVYFRPDSTQVWGQIGTMLASYKGYYSVAGDYLNPRLVYWNNKLYLFGLTKVNEARGGTTNLSKYVLVSSDGGVTWTDFQVADSIAIRLTAFHNIMGCSLDKNKPNSTILRVSNNAAGNLQNESNINIDFATNMIVETNNSDASPTTTTVYTRIV